MGEASSKQKRAAQAALRLLEGQPDDHISPLQCGIFLISMADVLKRLIENCAVDWHR
jgi:hypothetical protein